MDKDFFVEYLDEKFRSTNTQLETIKASIDSQLEAIKKDMVTQISCYKNHEPIRFYLWLVGIGSSFGSSVLTTIIVAWLKG